MHSVEYLINCSEVALFYLTVLSIIKAVAGGGAVLFSSTYSTVFGFTLFRHPLHSTATKLNRA